MKKIFLFTFALFIVCTSTLTADSLRFNNPKKFATEFSAGIRVPLGITRDDILAGFSFKLGIGYQLSSNLEIFHVAFDVGTSTPHDPLGVEVYDPYNYYPRLEQETVSVYGFPSTMR